jgi:5-methylcytosine-specific restriction endonuclease McrA
MVEINPQTKKPIRIFKYPARALFLPPDIIAEWPRKEAVESIRRQAFEKYEYLCRYCGATVTWATGHCDEETSKGRGGEVSIDNCQILCSSCHIGPKGKHSDRLPKWSKHDSQ